MKKLLSLILCFILILCFLTAPKNNRLYTYQEFMGMSSMERYELFLKEGLELPDHYKQMEKEEVAEFLGFLSLI